MLIRASFSGVRSVLTAAAASTTAPLTFTLLLVPLSGLLVLAEGDNTDDPMPSKTGDNSSPVPSASSDARAAASNSLKWGSATIFDADVEELALILGEFRGDSAGRALGERSGCGCFCWDWDWG